MCEFCAEHSEGKKWYLDMKNYSRELLVARMTGRERELAGVDTRLEWLKRFVTSFVVPAAGAAARDVEWGPDEHGDPEVVLEQWKTVHFGQVVPLKDVPEILSLARSVTRMPCGCRFRLTGKTDQRYCFGFGVVKGGSVEGFDVSSSFETMRPEAAFAIIRKFDEEGLMHSVWTGMTPYVIGLCNCDHDCAAYRGYIEDRGRPRFFRAEYVAEVNPDLCTGCKTCMKQCQFAAAFYSSADAKVTINPVRCFGCGVCAGSCPARAITLLERSEHPRAGGIWLETPAKTG